MSQRGQSYGRQDNTEKIRTYIRDSENTMTYSPNDHTGNKFFGTWNKLLNLQNMLFYENKEKYLNDYQARFNAKLEIGSLPLCFGQCVNGIEESAMSGGLTSEEKNCMRECYFKRVSARDDMNMLFQQKLAIEQMRGHRDLTV
jgi:phosphoribulokinase